MEKDEKQVYRLTNLAGDPNSTNHTRHNNGLLYANVDGSTTFEDNIVVMKYFNLRQMSHELKHGHQFFTGDLSFSIKTKGGGLLHDTNDEIEAFYRQSAFQSKLSAPIQILTHLEIRNKGYENLPRFNLNVNTSYGDVMSSNFQGNFSLDTKIANTPFQNYVPKGDVIHGKFKK